MRRISCFAQPTGTVCCCRCSLLILFFSRFVSNPIFFSRWVRVCIRSICESYAYKYKEDAPFIFVIFETNVWYEMHICCSFLFSYSVFFVCAETFGIYTSFGFYSAPNANCMRRNKRNEEKERKMRRTAKKIIAFVWYVRQSFVLVFVFLLFCVLLLAARSGIVSHFQFRRMCIAKEYYATEQCNTRAPFTKLLLFSFLEFLLFFIFWLETNRCRMLRCVRRAIFIETKRIFANNFLFLVSFHSTQTKDERIFCFVLFGFADCFQCLARAACIPVSYFVATGNSASHSTDDANLNVFRVFFLFCSASAQFLFRFLSSFADFRF